MGKSVQHNHIKAILVILIFIKNFIYNFRSGIIEYICLTGF